MVNNIIGWSRMKKNSKMQSKAVKNNKISNTANSNARHNDNVGFTNESNNIITNCKNNNFDNKDCR